MSIVYGTLDPATVVATGDSLPIRNVGRAMLRGLAGRCPLCGKGAIFHGFTSVHDACPQCGEILSHQRADDFPPYIAMFITGHIVITAMLLVERAYHPALWIHMALWLPLTVLLALGTLRPAKGAIIGLQWALYMHGFDPRKGEDRPVDDPAARLRGAA